MADGDDTILASGRLRLDEALVARGLVASRSRARDLVKRGLVRVAGAIASRPSQAVAAETELIVQADAAANVSRGAEKLIAALDAFGFARSATPAAPPWALCPGLTPPQSSGKAPAALRPHRPGIWVPGAGPGTAADRTAAPAATVIALDLGASTGGFTEVLLARGAARVYAVDVGHGQLHASLAGDPRVVSLEGTDARDLDRAIIPEPVDAITADLSFISLTKALPAALALAAPGCWLAALIKPQFEAGRAAVARGGIVRDAGAREAAVANVRDWLDVQPGWHVVGVIPSPITGGSGNVEYLIGARHDG